MRISTRLDDDDRDAVKEYAVNNGYTMKEAYTRLIRDALYDSFSIRLSPETGNIGVKFSGYNSSVLTNVSRERFMDRLRYYDGDWCTVYAPRAFALERSGTDPELDPTFWIDGSDMGADEAVPEQIDTPDE